MFSFPLSKCSQAEVTIMCRITTYRDGGMRRLSVASQTLAVGA
jgi:hypothetical protein